MYLPSLQAGTSVQGVRLCRSNDWMWLVTGVTHRLNFSESSEALIYETVMQRIILPALGKNISRQHEYKNTFLGDLLLCAYLNSVLHRLQSLTFAFIHQCSTSYLTLFSRKGIFCHPYPFLLELHCCSFLKGLNS